MFTVDYTNNEIADDPAQHKQSHVMELLDAGEWTGNIVALPNNRVWHIPLGLKRERAKDLISAPSFSTHSLQQV